MREARATAVLFDLDGVLIDSRVAITRSINHALRTFGLPARPQPELVRFIGPPLAVAFAELTGAAVESPLVRDCVGAYRDRYKVASLRETRLVPGIDAALAELSTRHRLAIATSKARPFAEPLLEWLGILRRFDAVAAPGLHATSESKATTIAAALAAVGSTRAVMVGDRSFDVEGARANGLPAIGVTWGIGDRAELCLAGSDVVVSAPGELLEAVPALLGQARSR